VLFGSFRYLSFPPRTLRLTTSEPFEPPLVRVAVEGEVFLGLTRLLPECEIRESLQVAMQKALKMLLAFERVRRRAAPPEPFG
jgi:hypothetical protein